MVHSVIRLCPPSYHLISPFKEAYSTEDSNLKEISQFVQEKMSILKKKTFYVRKMQGINSHMPK